MNFSASHPIWMWLYFGTFGSAGAILFTLVIWNCIKVHSLAKGAIRSATKWNMTGYMFLFIASWFACGIGGPPGNLLSSDITLHALTLASPTAALSIFFSVPGWMCILIGQRKMIKAIK